MAEAAIAAAVAEAMRPAEAQPGLARAHYDAALRASVCGDNDVAIAALRQATRLDPARSVAWRKLGDLLARAGEPAAAGAAYQEYVRKSGDDAELRAATRALRSGDLTAAEATLTARLKRIPTDVAALRLLAEARMQLGRLTDAEGLLNVALALAPGFAAARHDLALTLFRLRKIPASVAQAERLVRQDGRNASYRTLLASSLAMMGRYGRAISLYEDLLRDMRRETRIWLSYGNALRHAGRRAESVRAYRTCIDIAPACGEAWWCLANLKSERFSEADRQAMGAALARPDLPPSDRIQLHYALGAAQEQAGAYEASFANYEAGSRLRRGEIEYSAGTTTQKIERAAAFYTHEFFAAREGQGCADPAPIFIVGLPRAGSTLIEQILSSHSRVEGTMELPEMTNLMRDLGASGKGAPQEEILASLTEAQLAELGARYLAQAKFYRQTDKPFFVDKLPENWVQVGFIRAILPRAKIIDARRDPMGCVFSNFRQYFPFGQEFSYDLSELAQYYRDYVGLMAHFDRVLPGFVHRVMYEDMVTDTEREVRRLLTFCGLDFEPACLRFWETERAVHTASSEQVRGPIFREGLDQWRNYSAWLKEGSVLF